MLPSHPKPEGGLQPAHNAVESTSARVSAGDVGAGRGPRLPIGMTATPSGRTNLKPFPLMTASEESTNGRFDACLSRARHRK